MACRLISLTIAVSLILLHTTSVSGNEKRITTAAPPEVVRFEELSGTFSGPVTFDFLTSTTLVVSERTCLSLIELQSKVKTPLVGSTTSGGYVDGVASEARFSLINDVVIQGNFVYIADYSCVRIYDIERKMVATLAGACGRIDEPVTSVAPPVFSGGLKLAVSARDLYVLHGEKISRVDRETGVVWTLSAGERLSQGAPTSIEVDKYTNTLFVSVVRPSAVDVLAVDIAGGRQSLYGTVKPSNKGSGGESDLTASVASLDVAPDGTVFVIEPHGLHKIARQSKDITSEKLDSYGYHEVGVSSRFLVMSQEFYSRMYKLYVKDMKPTTSQEDIYSISSQKVTGDNEQNNLDFMSWKLFESHTFYLAIVFPSVLFILVIIVVICAARRIIKSRSHEHPTQLKRPVSDISSEKFFLNSETPETDNTYWM